VSTILNKTVFLIVSGAPERIAMFTELIENHTLDAVIYSAPSGNVGLMKTKNATVDIVIADSETVTPDVFHMVDIILHENKNPKQAVMVVGLPATEDKFVDALVTGKLYFLDEELKDNEFSHLLVKALNFTTHIEPSSFYLRYLAAGDTLIKEGEEAEFVYILKSGQLQAYNIINGNKVVLGNVETGEFVGEMAYINNEPRSAFIEALVDSQLIEVPIGLVDKIIYKRPAWSKALLQTLSRRLKTANKNQIKE
jgi:CRP/FNR family cyclic AMP-dependent transcriptional regulator